MPEGSFNRLLCYKVSVSFGICNKNRDTDLDFKKPRKTAIKNPQDI